MKELSNEQTEFAVTTLDRMVESRGVTQSELQDLTKISQSAISKFFSRDLRPNAEQLEKLFHALGLKLHDVLELEAEPEYIYGYLATPLTGIDKNPRCDSELRSVVKRIKNAAADRSLGEPPFDIYWPGDYTHPTSNADVSASVVYLTDRSRASTNDFVVMFCGSPSYGVGQENEIATQAGVPVIRLVPTCLSRMLSGSFARAESIVYSGSLETGIAFDETALKEALRQVRVTYYHHRALYRNLNGRAFGDRLKQLIDQRIGGYDKFAIDLGIRNSYLHALFSEQIAVSNPSLRLLKRMAARLDTTVSYLLGEEPNTDPIWIQSHNTLRSWIESDPTLSASTVFEIRDEWRQEYRLNRYGPSVSSFRNATPSAMRELDWQEMYKNRKRLTENATGKLFA